MNKATKSFIWIVSFVIVVAIVGVFQWQRESKNIGTTSSITPPSAVVVPPPPVAHERIPGIDTRVLLYNNGRKADGDIYSGNEPDVITVVDALTNEVVAIVTTTITPDIRGATNPYVLVGEKIYFYNQTDRLIESLDFSGALTKLAFTQSPTGRSYHNFIVSKDGKRISWSRSTKGGKNSLRTAMWVADIDGKNQKLLQEKEIGPESYFSLFGFSNDNTVIYYAEEAGGRGGYILFAGPRNMSKMTVATGQVLAVEPTNNVPQFITDVSNDESELVVVQEASNVTEAKVLVFSTSDHTLQKEIPIPAAQGFTGGGAAKVSPDNRYVVYNVARINPGDEKIEIRVYNREDSREETLYSSTLQLRVEKWITNDSLVVSSDTEPGIKYILRVSGTGLTRLGEKPK